MVSSEGIPSSQRPDARGRYIASVLSCGVSISIISASSSSSNRLSNARSVFLVPSASTGDMIECRRAR